MLLRHLARRAASTGNPMQLKVGVVGAGAVGTYMGVRLAELGHDVRFLVMGSKPTPTSLKAISWQGDATLDGPTVARSPAELAKDGPLDWVLCGLKSTALEADAGAAFANLVAPCVAPATRVQLLMNGLGAEEACAAALGGDPGRVHGGLVYGGFAWADDAASHAGVPGAIHGGSLSDDPAELEAAARLWEPAVAGAAPPPGAVVYAPQPCLRLAQWSKLAWNAPFNGCTVLAGGADVGQLWGDPEGRAAAIGVMREVIRAANADLAAHGAAPRIDEEALVAKMSAITDDMAAASYIPSTTKDFLAGRRMEVQSIFEEPLRRARAHGVEAPRLETLAALLRVANDRIAAPSSWKDVT